MHVNCRQLEHVCFNLSFHHRGCDYLVDFVQLDKSFRTFLKNRKMLTLKVHVDE